MDAVVVVVVAQPAITSSATAAKAIASFVRIPSWLHPPLPDRDGPAMMTHYPPLPPFDVTIEGPVSVKWGEQIELQARVARATGPMTYIWTAAGRPLAGLVRGTDDRAIYYAPTSSGAATQNVQVRCTVIATDASGTEQMVTGVQHVHVRR